MQRTRFPQQIPNCNSRHLSEGLAFLSSLKAPYVLKADGLAAGKGVLISRRSKKLKVVERNAGGQFGSASSKVVIEEFLSGIECSVFAITDGINYKILPEAKDTSALAKATPAEYRRNGSYQSGSVLRRPIHEKVEDAIVRPTLPAWPTKTFRTKGLFSSV
jgi:phosphoribosylamine--glycine ligase